MVAREIACIFYIEKMISSKRGVRRAPLIDSIRKNTLLSDLSPLLIPILIMLTPIVGIIAWAAVKITRMNLLHETVRHLSKIGRAHV